MNKKKIISIVLILLVVLLGGASVYVATQLSTRQEVAPNAPASEPRASESEWADCPSTVTAVVTEVTCDPLVGVITCDPDCPVVCGTDDPDCPVVCGTDALTISTCQDSCGVATTKNCPATALCGEDGGWGELSACSATACGTSGTKTRTCNNPAPSNGGAECTRDDGTLTTPSARTETSACSAVACGVDGGWGELSACSATACGTSGTKTRTCNNPAPSNGGAECTRDDGTLTTPSARTETSACSAVACAGATAAPTAVATAAPTAVATAAPIAVATAAPTAVVAQPTVLPETGILDFPGVAAFGGGLLLAIIGILLAL